jgi:hypothetical protein
MASFSQRMGFVPLAKAIQTRLVDEDLRNKLWNNLCVLLWNPHVSNTGYADPTLRSLTQTIWHDHFSKPLDTIPNYFKGGVNGTYQILRDFFMTCDWSEVYDLIEFIIKNSPPGTSDLLTTATNKALEQECAGYRVVAKEVVPITDKLEIEAVDAATKSPLEAVREHLSSAIAKYSDRTSPDYRNSVKESISAVEAVCKHVTKSPNATLGQCVKKVKGIHPAFSDGLSKLYGFTSDGGGIRHALTEGDRVPTAAEAKLMLVLCSGFVNYMTELEAAGELE